MNSEGCCWAATISGGGTAAAAAAAAKVQKSGLAGTAQNPPAPPEVEPTMELMLEVSSLPLPSSSVRTRFPKMKGAGLSKVGLWSDVEGEDSEAEVELEAEPLTETETVEKLAGVVPVPVAAMMEGSA